MIEKGYYWNDGHFYYGQWLDNLPHGFGLYITGDILIQGQFKAGLLDGYCRIQVAEATTFSNFNLGLQNGLMKRICLSGEIQFVGRQAKPNEQQLLRSLDSKLYSTQLKTQLKHWVFDGTSHYFGSFFTGKIQQNGVGMVMGKNGRIEFGNFVNAKLEGLGGILFESSDRYYGCFKSGQLFGNGVFYNSQDKIFVYGRFEGNSLKEVIQKADKPILFRSQPWHQITKPEILKPSNFKETIFPQMQGTRHLSPIGQKSKSLTPKKGNGETGLMKFGQFEAHFSSKKSKATYFSAAKQDSKTHSYYQTRLKTQDNLKEAIEQFKSLLWEEEIDRE